MRYIKTYKIFENNNSELESKLKEFKIVNYTINQDGTINVDGDVYLMNKLLTEIPFLFGKVDGHLSLYDNELTNLRGCPIEVGGDFICSNNELKSLEHCASEIDNNFYCSYNKLTMLDCSSYIKGDIVCRGNGFTEEPEFFGDCEGRIKWK